MTTAADVVTAARSWIGTRWLHQGRAKGIGCDCAGLVIGVARELGLADVNIADYGRTPSRNQLIQRCSEHMQRVGAPAVGCVALMQFEREPQHLGIVGDYPGGGLSLIHAYAQQRRVVEHRLDDVWAGYVVAVFALPGVR